MSAVVRPDSAQPPRSAVLPAGFDWGVFAALAVGLAAFYVPTFLELARVVWPTDEQGHGPIILAVSLWLLYQRRHDIAALPRQPRTGIATAILVFCSMLYVVGVSQQILMFQVGSFILVLAALLLLYIGWGGLRAALFPLFFLIFMVPLPEALVAAVTAPLKSAVSAVASALLYQLGYPIARSGVMLTIGQYQLLVADACAGLNSMFTLEALGMLYMNLMRYTSIVRNVTLALLLVPIAFCANIVRVVILVLVTYYFGDEAGQGFVHGFAGMVLFLVALMLMLTVDRLLGWVLARRGGA